MIEEKQYYDIRVLGKDDEEVIKKLPKYLLEQYVNDFGVDYRIDEETFEAWLIWKIEE